MSAEKSLKRYECHKQVMAAKITAINLGNCLSFHPKGVFIEGEYVSVSAEYFQKHKPQVGGYYVLYEDGYESWSPAKAFESGYTLVVDVATITDVSDAMKAIAGGQVPASPQGLKGLKIEESDAQMDTQVQDSDSVKPAYRVEADEGHAGCETCGTGRLWMVVGPGEVAESCLYEHEEDAADVADSLNAAFEEGVRSKDAVILKMAEETLEVKRMLERAQYELRQWSQWGVVEIATRNPNVDEYCKHWEGRVKAAETGKDEALTLAQDCIYAARESGFLLVPVGPDNSEWINRRAEQAEAALERDRTAVASGVSAIKKAVQSRDWLTEGRGPFEWNDDNWHKEFAAAAKEILDAVEPLSKIAADLSNYPRTTEMVKEARSQFVAYKVPARSYTVGQELDLGPSIRITEVSSDLVPFNEYLSPAGRPVVDGLENLELVYAEHQPQYIPLRVLRGNTEEVPVLSRWTLTPEQRQAVAAGADVFLKLLVFRNCETGAPNTLQPIQLMVSHGLNADGIAKDFRLVPEGTVVDAEFPEVG